MEWNALRLVKRDENGDAISIGLPVLVIGALVVLALIGAGGAAVVSSVRAPSQQSDRFGPRPNYISMPAMSISIGGGSGREMDLKLLLEFEPKAKGDSVLGYQTRIEERLGDRVREIGVERLQGADGAKLIKGAVASVIDREIRPLRVKEVLIEKMVVR